MIKRVFNQDKTIELTNEQIDYDYGQLVEDRLFIAHHEAIAEVQEQSHVEVIAEYDNGGQDIVTVIDVPYVKACDAYDEYEDILVYIAHSGEELIKAKERKYKASVEEAIRNRYSVSDELAIHRQRDIKTGEWLEYMQYCEECKAKAKAEVYG